MGFLPIPQFLYNFYGLAIGWRWIGDRAAFFRYPAILVPPNCWLKKAIHFKFAKI
jgi:hypothetical protein